MPLIPKPWHWNVGALQELGKMRGFSSESRHRPSVARDAMAGGTSKVEKGEIRINPPLPAFGRIFFRGAKNFKHPSKQMTISLKSNDKWRRVVKDKFPMTKVKGMTNAQIPYARAPGCLWALDIGHFALVGRSSAESRGGMPVLHSRRDAHHYDLHHFAPLFAFLRAFWKYFYAHSTWHGAARATLVTYI
jgi:hypothetical protein